MNFDHIDNEERPWARRLAVWIDNALEPATVLDIGCGPGTYVDELRACGVTALGLDTDQRVVGHPYLTQKSLFDMTHERAQVVLCQEVAEHVPEEQADELVAQVVKAVEHTLIWTAAQPGQGGIGHINCQPPSYWADKITAQGLVRNTEKEQQLKDYARAGAHMGWFVNNLLYFERAS